MPRLVFISDTHLSHDEHQISIPDGDIVVHTGDATFRGSPAEISRFNEWYSSLPHKHKVFIAGNHDWLFELDNRLARSLLDNNITYLQDSEATVEGLRFWGAPWSPTFNDWAFNLDRGIPIKEKWDLIPDGIDILLTHGPPMGYGDRLPNGDPVGCEELIKIVKRIKPRIHAFGHIHDAYGIYRDGKIIFVNASTCNELYEPVNLPIIMDL